MRAFIHTRRKGNAPSVIIVVVSLRAYFVREAKPERRGCHASGLHTKVIIRSADVYVL